jgi:hypothetical protein
MRNVTKEELVPLWDLLHQRDEMQHRVEGLVIQLRKECGVPPGTQIDVASGAWVVGQGDHQYRLVPDEP